VDPADLSAAGPVQLYMAWGEARTKVELPTRYKFTGQYEDASGLYFYNARWYDTHLNRWTSPYSAIQDLYNQHDFDRYQYVRSNPTGYNDQTGHTACPLDNPNCNQQQPGTWTLTVNLSDEGTRADLTYLIESQTNLYKNLAALSLKSAEMLKKYLEIINFYLDPVIFGEPDAVDFAFDVLRMFIDTLAEYEFRYYSQRAIIDNLVLNNIQKYRKQAFTMILTYEGEIWTVQFCSTKGLKICEHPIDITKTLLGPRLEEFIRKQQEKTQRRKEFEAV
jgi:RHS repeat-associated protein